MCHSVTVPKMDKNAKEICKIIDRSVMEKETRSFSGQFTLKMDEVPHFSERATEKK